MVDHPGRTGPFWDMLEGRAPPPPAAELLGWTLREVDLEAGTIVVAFEAKPAFLNPMGTIQGGLLAAMLDDTLGPAAVAQLTGEQFAQTLELKTSFLRAAYPGQIIGRGRVVHRGREVVFMEGSLEDSRGRLLATATATARIVDLGTGGRGQP